MERRPEPELMDEPAQAKAYAEADFAEPHDRFVTLFCESFPEFGAGRVLDLGCGPADVTVRFALALPGVSVDGVDGAPNMLALGRKRVATAGLAQRVCLFQGYLPETPLPGERYDAVISNSLLHHLRDPRHLWETVRSAARPGARLFVMDLLRPPSPAEAERLVELHAEGAPELLRHDFYHSLCAAYRVPEVELQLAEAGLHGLLVQAVSDRHLVVSGVLE